MRVIFDQSSRETTGVTRVAEGDSRWSLPRPWPENLMHSIWLMSGPARVGRTPPSRRVALYMKLPEFEGFGIDLPVVYALRGWRL